MCPSVRVDPTFSALALFTVFRTGKVAIHSVLRRGVVFEGFLILEIAIYHSNIQVWVDDVRRSYQLPGQVIHM